MRMGLLSVCMLGCAADSLVDREQALDDGDVTTASTTRDATSVAVFADVPSGAGLTAVATVNGVARAPLEIPYTSQTQHAGVVGSVTPADTVAIELFAHTELDPVAVPVPVVTSGSRFVECLSPFGALETLDASRSTNTRSYAWSGPFGTVSGIVTTQSFPFGQSPVALRGLDDQGFVATHDFVVTVGDTVGPALDVASTIACIWPPNNGAVVAELGAALQAHATDTCDPNPTVRIASVVASDGTPMPFSGNRVCFRDFRAHTTISVAFEATDNAGNVTTRVLSIPVERDRTQDCVRPTDVSDCQF